MIGTLKWMNFRLTALEQMVKSILHEEYTVENTQNHIYLLKGFVPEPKPVSRFTSPNFMRYSGEIEPC